MTTAARGWGGALAAGLIGAVLLVLMARTVLDHPVHYDELLHILSARSLLQTGAPLIADGIYTRASVYTHLVAWSFSLFGDDPLSARLPALAAGAGLAFVLGVWVVRRLGLLTGVAAAVLLCVVPSTVDVAVFARFYSVHALLITVMFIAAYDALQPGRTAGVRAAAMALVVSIVLLGWHFQETTIIAAGALATAMLSLIALDYWTAVAAFARRRPLLVLFVLVSVAVLGVAVTEYVGLLDQLGTTALWAAQNASRPHYYLAKFRNELPLLWPLLPAAAVIAVLQPASRRLAVYCLVVVSFGLLLHSIAAQKVMRYVYYLVPLMCVVWASALANLMNSALECGGKARTPANTQHSSSVGWALVVAALLLSQEGGRSFKLLMGDVADLETRPFGREPNWMPLVAQLGPLARKANQVVTSNSMKALYYFGRYDYELNATIVPETETGADFGRDERTGRQAIGTAESVREVLDRRATTLVVIESSKIGRTSGVTSEAYAVIESHCSELNLPHSSGVRAWWCNAPPAPRRD